MGAAEKDNYCRRLRSWVHKLLTGRFTLDRQWIQNHIANCPRCRKRIAYLGRVDLALSLLKSEPHNLDLLMRANTQAIGVLKHSLRRSVKAEKLKYAKPEPGIIEQLGKYKHSLANAAACIVIAFLMKAGTFSSAETLQNEGQKAVEHYYAKQLGDDLAREIFTTHA